MGTPAMIALIALALVVAGTVYFNLRPEGEIMMEKGSEMIEEGDAMMKEGESMIEEGDAMIKEGESMMEDGGDSSAMSSSGVSYHGDVLAEGQNGTFLLDFNSQDYENAIANEKLVVLYFYANWCPVCKAEFPKMQDAFKELNEEGVVGFRVNYNDNQTDDYERGLAKQFGVAYQHTKVFLKNGGERILKAPDSWDKDRYITEITNAL